MILEELMTTGARHSSDNVVVVNCSSDFMRMAKDRLVSNDDCRAINIVINANVNDSVAKFLDKVEDNDHQKIFTRTFIASIIMHEVLKNYDNVSLGFEYDIEDLSRGISAFMAQDIISVREYHIQHAPWSMDIERVVRKYGKMELNVFLPSMVDIRIQREINNYISSRLPFCVKVFTNEDRLSSYQTSFNEVIQVPHDFTEYDMIKLNSDFAV